MFDLLIKNGLIVDGSGSPAFKGDIAVLKGKIESIEPSISDGMAYKVIDANGLIIAPGFIDIHSHSDILFLQDDRCESKIYQGVTSEVMGQCGTSVYPCPQDKRERIEEYAGEKAMGFASCSLAEFAEKITKQNKRMGTNLMPLTGHCALRCGVMGYDDRHASGPEIKQMAALLEQDMRDGSWGLSLGLAYVPGISSEVNELCDLAAVVTPFNGIVTSHLRSQGVDTPKYLDEMYEIFRRSGAHIHIAHFKASGKAAWGLAPEFVKNVRDAQAGGINVTVDVYPYTAASSGITNSFPKWAVKGGKEHTMEIIKGPQRQELVDYLEERFPAPDGGEALLIVGTDGLLPEADGKNLKELGELWGISAAQAAVRVAEETRCNTRAIAFSMCDEDVDYMLAQDDFAIASDGRAHPFAPELNDGKPHPRNFGTFPRFLRLSREKKLCSLETAVRRMTGLSADIMGIGDRGYIRPGLIADLTLFDYEKVKDNADYKNPFQKPDGIVTVIINGEIALYNGVQTDVRAGSLILKK